MQKKVIIIAEAGVNHNGSLEIAKEMVIAAKYAGADYVKFQTFISDKAISKHAKKANYQITNCISENDSQLEMVRKLELSHQDHLELISFCDKIGIKFFSTAFDLESVTFLKSLDLGVWKIPSGEITNFPYLKQIALYHEPIILSTGMCGEQDIDIALSVLGKYGIKKEMITILHCNTEYPTPMYDVNLQAMLTMHQKYGVNIGYSDHTMGIEIPIAAVALGAKVIEKHFTLDRTMNGPDHKASLEPDELKRMIKAIRNVEDALGQKQKMITDSERKNITIARKSIVASRSIYKGEIFSENNITTKRPANGLSPMLWEDVLGKKAIKDFTEDECIVL